MLLAVQSMVALLALWLKRHPNQGATGAQGYQTWTHFQEAGGVGEMQRRAIQGMRGSWEHHGAFSLGKLEKWKESGMHLCH